MTAPQPLSGDHPALVALVERARLLGFADRVAPSGELILENFAARLTAPRTAEGVRSLRRQLDDWEPGGRLFSFPSRIF